MVVPKMCYRYKCTVCSPVRECYAYTGGTIANKCAMGPPGLKPKWIPTNRGALPIHYHVVELKKERDSDGESIDLEVETPKKGGKK